MDEMIRKQIKKFISELSGKDLMGIYFIVRGYYNGKKIARRCANTDEHQEK